MKRISISFPLALAVALTWGILLALTATLAQTVFMQRQWNLEEQRDQKLIEARRLEEQRQQQLEAARQRLAARRLEGKQLAEQKRLEQLAEQNRPEASRLEQQRQQWAPEAGAAEFGNPASGNAPYLWSGSKEQGAIDGVAPSVSSAEQKASNRVSPSQDTGPVVDPSVGRVADSLAAVATPGNHAYRIGPLDVLDVSVFQAPDLSKTVEVADNGMVDLPLIGETPAAGKTASELQRDLSAKLGAKYLQNPQVSVRVVEYNSNRVTVSGAIRSPGVFQY